MDTCHYPFVKTHRSPVPQVNSRANYDIGHQWHATVGLLTIVLGQRLETALTAGEVKLT